MTSKDPIKSAGQVLFVDDDPFYRDLAADTLESANYAVTTAEDGADAKTKLDGGTFDLMVLDLSMPGISGFEVLDHVRQVRKLTDLPVLVITGHDDADSVMRAFDLGATSFLAKPLNWILFVQHVEFVLKSARAQAELRHAQRSAEFMSELKSRLVGTLVTEFQAPLRSAYGFARLLKEETDGPIGSDLYVAWIDDLHRSIEKLNTTHLKMLNFGQSLSETISLNEETLHIAALLETVLKNHRDTANRRQIAIQVINQTPDRCQIRGDGILLAQVLRGVLEHAITFSTRGTEIRLSVQIDDRGQCILETRDTSPGLAAAQIDEILGLKSFASARAESVETNSSLKMSRVLMEAHQGSMRLRSLGDGMLTELILPRSRVVRAPISAAANASGTLTTGPSITQPPALRLRKA
jgi:two-component system, sensor histidine kinase and response regulator